MNSESRLNGRNVVAGEDRMEDDQEHKGENAAALNVAVSAATVETVRRYGSSNAEFVKAYTGVDNALGKALDKGLNKISKYKVDPKFHEQNIKQQAGYSAEVHKVASTNAENIIQGKPGRLSRTDDLPQQYGTNHTVYDHVELDANGIPVLGTESQMKFVKDYENLLTKIAQGHGGKSNDLSRYLNADKLDLPSEQVENARIFCEKKARDLRQEADALDKKGIKPEVAAQKRSEAENYQQLGGKIRDCGMTTEQAVFLRKHPKVATALDIAAISHRSGIEGAKLGAAVGGAVSIVTNVIAVCQNGKGLREAIVDTARQTGKAAAVGYGTAFAGSVLKGLMEQSSRTALRSLSRTSLPAMAVTVCLEFGSVAKRHAQGKISGAAFLDSIGERGCGLLAGGLGASLGQIAIPIPVAGALIGAMVAQMATTLAVENGINTPYRQLVAESQTLPESAAMLTDVSNRIFEAQALFEHFVTVDAKLDRSFNEQTAIARASCEVMRHSIDKI